MTAKSHPTQPRARCLPAVVIHPPRIDWSQLIADLRRHGCSLHHAARLIGAEYSTAQRWRKARSDPGYGYGRALILLHARICKAGLTLQRLCEADERAYKARMFQALHQASIAPTRERTNAVDAATNSEQREKTTSEARAR